MRACVFGMVIAGLILTSGSSAHAGATNLPAASTYTVTADAGGVIAGPTNLFTANSIARAIDQVVAMSEDCSGPWYSDGAGGLTNAAGWRTTGATNVAGGLALGVTQYVQSALSPSGYARATNNAAGNISVTLQISEDGSAWTSAARTASRVYLRWTADDVAPIPDGTNLVTVDDFVVWGWAQTSMVGRVQDFAGLRLQADQPAGDVRDLVTVGYVQGQIAAISVTGGGSSWSEYAAIAPVNLDGQAVALDTRYGWTITNDTWSMTYAGAPVMEINGGGSVTPTVTYFNLSGTTITMRAVASLEYRLYPEWSTNLSAWTRYATNAFTSTWPALTNGQATLRFTAVTNDVAYYRAAAVQEITNGLSLSIRVPLQVDGPVTGDGMAAYVGTGTLSTLVSTSALTATLTGYVSTSSLAGTLTGYVSTSSLAGTLTGYVSTSALTDTLTGYVSTSSLTDTLTGYASTSSQAEAIAAVSTSLTASITWLRVTDYPTLVVDAVSGAEYNGPVQGSRFFVFDEVAPHRAAYDGNTESGTPVAYIYAGVPHNYAFMEVEPWLLPAPKWTNLNFTGTWLPDPSTSATGTFSTITGAYSATNRVPFLTSGVGLFSGFDGPCTNQFAPPRPPVVWSGSWTSIVHDVTNVLQFWGGIATNKVTLP